MLPIELGTVICGIDSSPQSIEASRQAIAVADQGARIWGLSVWDPGFAVHAGIHASTVAVDLRNQAVTALRGAQAAHPALEPLLIRGREVAGLLAAAANLEADLVSVGSHGTSRPAGILFGSVATAMLHHAPCCVLIAREVDNASFPRAVLCAGDGSADSLDAARVAGRIAARHDAAAVALHVTEGHQGGEGIAEELAATMRLSGADPEVRVDRASADRRIVEVAGDLEASLIVVGSRGLTGLKALGSVSERVAHRASCSVLVVRRPAHPTQDRL